MYTHVHVHGLFIISIHLVPGLTGSKMSASDPVSLKRFSINIIIYFTIIFYYRIPRLIYWTVQLPLRRNLKRSVEPKI